MRIYTVHLPPWTLGGAGEAVFIREGFNWLAAIFGPFWSLYHGLWLTTLALVLANLALLAVLAGVGPAAGGALCVGYLLFVGFSANDWHRRGLERRGYRFDRVVVAVSRTRAEIRYFAKGADAKPSA